MLLFPVFNKVCVDKYIRLDRMVLNPELYLVAQPVPIMSAGVPLGRLLKMIIFKRHDIKIDRLP